MLSHTSGWLRAGRTRERSSGTGRGKIFSSQSRQDWLWGPPKPPVEWVARALSTGVSGWGFKLTTHPQLMPRSKIRGSISHLSSWRSVQSVKHSNIFTFPVLMRTKPVSKEYILTIYVCGYRRDLDWWVELLTTHIHDSELQAITAQSLIYTLRTALHSDMRHSTSSDDFVPFWTESFLAEGWEYWVQFPCPVVLRS
jgi:hypothetical protein